MFTSSKLHTNGVYLFQYGGNNLLGKHIEMTLILIFLKNNKVFKIETPEIVEMERGELADAVNELQTIPIEEIDDSDEIGTYAIQSNTVSIKFKKLQLAGTLSNGQMHLDINVEYVDWIQGKVVSQRVLQDALFRFVAG